MVLIVSNDGKTSLTPQSVTAGTTAASIVVVSPFPEFDTCALYFGLPNGERSAPRVIIPSAKQEFEEGVAYEFRFTPDIVAYRGLVEVTAEFTSSDGLIFRSETASFNVTGPAGISVPEYAESDPWAEVAKAIAGLVGTVGTFGAVVQTTGQSEKDVMSQKAVTDLFADLTYVPPTVSSLSLNPVAGGYKLPKSYQLLKITHRESNAENIAGKLTLKRGTTVLKNDIEPSATATDVAITDSAVVLTASGIAFTLSGVDKKGNAFSKTATVSGYYTAYIGASDNVAPTTAMVQGLTDVNAARLSGTRTVTFTGSEKYIWFCSTVSALSVTSSGFTVPLTSGGTVTVNGQTYYCFRTADKVLAGTHTFVIA